MSIPTHKESTVIFANEQLARAADQQQMGAYTNLLVSGEIADLPNWDASEQGPSYGVWQAELVKRIKDLQARRALHYSRARNLLGLHD